MDGLRVLEGVLSGPHIITGNTAKVRTILELQRRLETNPRLRILDVGCVGPAPLQFWEALLDQYQFHLTGVDVEGIDLAASIVRRHGWESKVQLLNGSGYHLSKLLDPESFDIVVATQVLEHVAKLRSFLQEVTAVLKPGGETFLTLDSAHWRGRYTLRLPIRALKNVAKRILSAIGNERHYDLPLYDFEVIAACEQSGLEVRACRYYNLAPLKWLHNRYLSDTMKNGFLRVWFEFEEFLNDAHPVGREVRRFFMGLYVYAHKA